MKGESCAVMMLLFYGFIQEEVQEHHWKLSLKRHRMHIGESPWTHYKSELYKSLVSIYRQIKYAYCMIGLYIRTCIKKKHEM